MKRVLIVDDEFGIVEAIADVLGDEGYQVATARNGRDALRRIDEVKPDLLIIDYMMPVMDGLQLITYLKQGPHAQLPIVLMTAVKSSQLPNDLDVQAVLEKPFGVQTLLQLVRRHIG